MRKSYIWIVRLESVGDMTVGALLNMYLGQAGKNWYGHWTSLGVSGYRLHFGRRSEEMWNRCV